MSDPRRAAGLDPAVAGEGERTADYGAAAVVDRRRYGGKGVQWRAGQSGAGEVIRVAVADVNAAGGLPEILRVGKNLVRGVGPQRGVGEDQLRRQLNEMTGGHPASSGAV